MRRARYHALGRKSPGSRDLGRNVGAKRDHRSRSTPNGSGLTMAQRLLGRLAIVLNPFFHRRPAPLAGG
jgi:hypothetical protein